MVYCPLQVKSGVNTSKNMSAKDWKIDMKQLESLITPQTKMIVLNTPHNPVGKVFTMEELQQIAEVTTSRHYTMSLIVFSLLFDMISWSLATKW